MRPSSVSKALLTCVQANQPVMLHGSPGGGKSQIVKQLAQELGYDFRDVRLSQLDPVDLLVEVFGRQVHAIADGIVDYLSGRPAAAYSHSHP